MKGQLTGMRGVYLVAAELSRLGFIASPTSRSALAADILVTDQACRRAFSVQVKSNAAAANFWLVGKHTVVSNTHVYVFVNLRSRKTQRSLNILLSPAALLRITLFTASTRTQSFTRSIGRTSLTTGTSGMSSVIRTHKWGRKAHMTRKSLPTRRELSTRARPKKGVGIAADFGLKNKTPGAIAGG